VAAGKGILETRSDKNCSIFCSSFLCSPCLLAHTCRVLLMVTIEYPIVVFGLLIIYIISCIIVSVCRKLKTFNPKISKLFAIFSAILLVFILIWAYYPSYSRFLRRESEGTCKVSIAFYCAEWEKCNFECKPDIPLLPLTPDEYEKTCVDLLEFKYFENLTRNECERYLGERPG